MIAAAVAAGGLHRQYGSLAEMLSAFAGPGLTVGLGGWIVFWPGSWMCLVPEAPAEA